MKFTDWTSDFHAREVYREIERALGPTLARIMPEFNMVKLGIIKRDGWDGFNPARDSVELRIHLKPNGLRMPSEAHFQRDPMDGFNDGTLEAINGPAGIEITLIPQNSRRD